MCLISRDEWRFLHELQRRKQLLTKCYVEIELPQIIASYKKTEENNNQQNISSTLIAALDHKHIDGEIKIKSNLEPMHKVATTTIDSFKDSSKVEYDTANDNYITKKFKEKLKAAKMDIKSLKIFISNSNNSNNGMNKNASTIGNGSGLHIENLNSLTRRTETCSSAPISGIISPAAENKSYDYHGSYMNSCKNNIDAIKRNVVDAIAKEDTRIETSQCLANEIKDCNCKLHQQHHLIQNKNNFDNIVENLSYFKSYSGSLSHENLKSTLASPTAITTTNLKTSTDATNNMKNKLSASNINGYKRLPLACGDLLEIARQVAVGMVRYGICLLKFSNFIFYYLKFLGILSQKQSGTPRFSST